MINHQLYPVAELGEDIPDCECGDQFFKTTVNVNLTVNVVTFFKCSVILYVVEIFSCLNHTLNK